MTHVYSICTKYSIKERTAMRVIVAGMQYNRQEAGRRAGMTEKTAHEYKNRFQEMTPQERGALLAEAGLRLVRDAQIAREQ